MYLYDRVSHCLLPDADWRIPTASMSATFKIRKTVVTSLGTIQRHASAGQDSEGITVTSGMPACRCRMKLRRKSFRRHYCHVRNAGMPAPDEIKKAKLHVRHAGMPAPVEIQKAKLYVRHAGMPAPAEIKKAKLQKP